ncbi:MAG: SDR family oxidoreductase [Actinobacteria bacterium]|nr:SDR family oxidoreductase [Actinomycetota bacterium]
MGRLDHKVAVITGGGRGIGKGIALRFAAEGASLALCQRDPTSLQTTVGQIVAAGGAAFGTALDVTDPLAVQRLIDAAIATYGRIDILVNNAGKTGRIGPFLEVSLDDWRAYLETNLTAAFVVAQAVARRMVEQGVKGRIVNIGSVDSFAAEKDASPYAASKGGLWLLTRAMAVDLGPYGVAVNLIAPGPILVERSVEKYKSEELRAARAKAIPLGAHGNVADVAAAAVYLASDECRYVTGAALTVDGGLMASLAI